MRLVFGIICFTLVQGLITSFKSNKNVILKRNSASKIHMKNTFTDLTDYIGHLSKNAKLPSGYIFLLLYDHKNTQAISSKYRF